MANRSNFNPRIAVIGLEGSGKTVLVTTLAKRLSTIDERGIFLNPQNVGTLKYVERIWSQLQNGAWPPSTPPGEMFELHWKLQVVGGIECELRLVDMAGQDLRQVFGQEKFLSPEEMPEHMRKVLEYCRDADIILVLLNIRDFVGQNDYEAHIDNQAALKSAIDYLNADDDKEVALILTQYDLYEESIRNYGGLGNFLMREMSYIFGAHVQGKPTMTMTLAAVGATEVTIDDEGIPHRVPAKDFPSRGLNGLVDWLVLAVETLKERGPRNTGSPAGFADFFLNLADWMKDKVIVITGGLRKLFGSE